MFPTHVGIALRRRGRRRVLADVPYACGDCAMALPRPSQSILCSLRMWGLRGQTAPAHEPVLMFPTHVGIARTGCAGRAALGDVPYACGDCATAIARRL